MNDLPGFASASSIPLTRWERTFLFLTGALASTILLKIAAIQMLELLYVVQFAILAATFYRARLQTLVYRPLLVLAIGYLGLSVALLILALAALRFTFYTTPEQTILQQPVVITIARLVELLLDAGMMIYLAGLFRTRLGAARFTMRVYFWTGVVSVVFSALSYPLDAAGIASLGAYGDLHRFRGFYNEGGPYGLYLVTLLAVGWTLMRLGWEPRRRFYWMAGLLSFGLLMAQSKASLAALVVLLIVRSFFASSLRQRAITVAASAAFLVLVLQTFDLGGKLLLYRQVAAKYEQASHLHSHDPNFVQGRVAGAFIVPRMIAAHPWTGIGFGNYGILRNDPEYRGAAVWGDPDEPGVGLLGVAAETGLPLIAVFMVLCLLPYFWLHRRGVPESVANLALLQPVFHVFGAQLNLTYPWIVTSFALGVGFALSRQPLASAARELVIA